MKDLAEKVYGVPMALRSLTSFLKTNRRLGIDALLQDETRFEDFRRHDYKTGLRKLIQEQYNILPDEGRLALQVLAVFNAPVKPVAVQYLLPKLDAEAVLDALAFDYFLAQENQDLFELHPAVQELAYEQIPVKSESGEESDPFARTALHTRAADFFSELKKPESEWKSLPDLQPHLDEIEQRMKAGQYDRAARVLLAIDFDYLDLWGHYGLMAELHEGLQGKIDDPKLKQRSVGNLGSAYWNMGQCDRAIQCYEQALENARGTKNRGGEGVWLGGLGSCYANLGEPARAIEYHEQALVIDREIGYRLGEAANLGNLGNRYSGLGETARAIEYHEQALLIHREIGYRQGEAADLGNLGNRYSDLGEPARAIEFYEQALVIDREIGYRQGEAADFGNLGNCYSALGEPARAIEYLEQALVIFREIGYRLGEAVFLVYSGDALADQHQWEKAIAAYHQAIQIADEIRNAQAQNEGQYGLALACLCTGELPQARTATEQGREYNYAPNLPDVLTLLGIIALRWQDSDTAKEAFTAAIREADALLSHGDRNYSALDAKALSLCGLALCEQNPGHIRDGAAAFKAAREITDAPGTVARVMRLSDELAKADAEGVLAQVPYL